MIYLDGFPYNVDKTNYADKPGTFADYRFTLTGDLDVVESGIYNKRPSFTLDVNQLESNQLISSFVRCHSGNVYLDFIDERDIAWWVAAGSNNATNYYSTGAWFANLSEPKPKTEALFNHETNPSKVWNPQKRFLVTIELILNTKVLA